MPQPAASEWPEIVPAHEMTWQDILRRETDPSPKVFGASEHSCFYLFDDSPQLSPDPSHDSRNSFGHSSNN